MNECGSCKHWRTHRGLATLGGSYGDEPAPGVWGMCDLAEFDGPKTGSSKFYVIDGSLYQASLNTRDDFGCIEWEGSGHEG